MLPEGSWGPHHYHGVEKAQIDVQSKNRGGTCGFISSVLPNSACPDSSAANLLVSLVTLHPSLPATPRSFSLVGWIFFKLLNRIFLSTVFCLLAPPFPVSFSLRRFTIFLGHLCGHLCAGVSSVSGCHSSLSSLLDLTLFTLPTKFSLWIFVITSE